ncbi:hypothetical protein L3Q82_000936 [Scortum barcoo]|uniref:Uncharacterized protein n=1 Tax=Scortum barcoo TaxID=214431 RepID=A0ACB8WBA6_9TELE|nr:hypothetical protein L3Q82_000936 [Scortum barcoo]
MITDSEVECVSSFKFLCVLTWTLNITQLIKKVHQRLYFLRRLRKFGMSQRTPTHRRHREHPDQLHHGVVREQHCCGPQTPTESGENGREDRHAPLPSLQDINHHRVHRRACSIIRDPSHPQHTLLSPLPSGRSEKLEASSVQDIKGHMEAVIKKIPSISVEGEVDIKLTEEEKALTNKFSCKFYGDFILESNPATFEDAVKTYVQLPKLLGENEEKAVPLKVWLMPLKNLFPDVPMLMSEISIALLAKMRYTLENLKKIGMRCSDSLVDRVVKNFPHIQEEVRTFQQLCNYYASYLQTTLAKKLPAIRDGKEDESSVRKLFDDRDKSPFSHKKLTKWLDHKEREINVVRSCVDVMEGTKIVTNQSELDREVLAAGVEDALCFVFTSMEKGDAYLDEMAKYLDSPTLGSTSEDEWYYSDEVLAEMKQKAKDFHNLSKAERNNRRFRFLVAAIANEKYKGATIYHYKDGILVTDNFSKPDIHNVETIIDRRYLIRYACDLTLDPNTANNYLHLSEGDKKATYGEWQTNLPYKPEKFSKADNPQVLCKQGLTGRHYWEVEWSDGGNQSVYVAVAYSQIQRRGGTSESQFGPNSVS